MKIFLVIYVIVVFCFSIHMTEKYAYQKGYIEAQLAQPMCLPAEMYSQDFAEWLWSGQTDEKK